MTLQFWFSCSHRHTTFPITLPDHARKVSPAGREPAHHTYITCLDCGKEFPYSWEKMRILPRRQIPAQHAASQSQPVG